MKLALIIIIVLSYQCYSQNEYNVKLSARLAEIKNETDFNNTVVIYDDTVNYAMSYPYWTPTWEFYADDLTRYKYCEYLALVPSKGKQPDISPNEWKVIRGPHPYIFLRDTARTEDLLSLLKLDHPFIRLYSFGALAKRSHSSLLQNVVENLGDTARISYFTADYGEYGYTADLMLWHAIRQFSPAEKDALKKLILTKYTHLNALEYILFFHKPVDGEYKYVREIATKDSAPISKLVALAKYRRLEDIELIRTGFNTDFRYGNNSYFFVAIENFPHADFKKQLISCSQENPRGFYMVENNHYLRALAAYKDSECLRVLEDYVAQKVETDINPDMAPFVKKERLLRIYHAMKKHYTPMYDRLMNRIEGLLGSQVNEGLWEDQWLERNPWNY